MKNFPWFYPWRDFENLKKSMGEVYLYGQSYSSFLEAKWLKNDPKFFIDCEDRVAGGVYVYLIDPRKKPVCDRCESPLLLTIDYAKNYWYGRHSDDKIVGIWSCPKSFWLSFWNQHTVLWDKVLIVRK